MTDAVDRAALCRLADDVGAQGARQFAERYLRALGERLERLRQAAAAQDRPGVRDAALSLASSSTMVGATALAEEAYAVVRRAAADPFQPFGTGGIGPLERLVGETSSVLAQLLH
ncbi:Hpt domain-containing protein [Puerhibacterium puerhi]|uniref:Hpt domain-containing protein n=1 Tax=Puerhibacterium puerhi TaxID=2692623 RepID=UPI00135BBFA2|nr:Hpt domain-containing protein [Puerhibacterium puerhi]